MDIKPIKKSLTLKDQAYQAIKEAIYSNSLSPGTPLTEEQLSATLSISRTPIRSALQQLVYEKLAFKDTTGHIYVSKITPKDVHDASMLRSVLEPLAIDSASFPVPKEYTDKLCRNYEAHILLFQNEPDNNFRYAEMDYEFHCLLCQICDNDLLLEIVQNLNNIMIRIHILSGTLNSHKQQALDEHAEIIDYIKKGQKEFAKLAVEEHIRNVESRMFTQDN